MSAVIAIEIKVAQKYADAWSKLTDEERELLNDGVYEGITDYLFDNIERGRKYESRR